jgi:GNAT superfamily N-acetyltransferase
MTFAIREMGLTDIATCRLLLSQLGYDLNPQELKRRYEAIREKQDHAIFVGEQDGQVVALLHVYERPAFDKPPEIIVQALVVDENSRGTGVGKAMMNRAECWAADRKFSSVALTSSVSRSDAHSFYNEIGYKVTATSHLFRKELGGLSAGLRATKLAEAMPGVETDESELCERLTAILRATSPLMRVFSVARGLCLPDWLVFSGAVYQPVLNHLTGRPLDYGIKDYDLAYFDDSDLSYEAEDAVIRRVRATFDEALRSTVEVRNQARVHLWFETKFGEHYTPLSCTADALERFASPMFAVGVRLEPDDRLHIEAPFGLADLFALRLRPNPRRKTVGFARTSANVRRRWPEIVIDNGLQDTR